MKEPLDPDCGYVPPYRQPRPTTQALQQERDRLVELLNEERVPASMSEIVDLGNNTSKLAAISQELQRRRSRDYAIEIVVTRHQDAIPAGYVARVRGSDLKTRTCARPETAIEDLIFNNPEKFGITITEER